MAANQYDPTDATFRQDPAATQQVQTVTAITTENSIDVPAPVQTVQAQDPAQTRKLDNGFAIW